MGSSQTRARTRVPCISRQILNHCTTREARLVILNCVLNILFLKLVEIIWGLRWYYLYHETCFHGFCIPWVYQQSGINLIQVCIDWHFLASRCYKTGLQSVWGLICFQFTLILRVQVFRVPLQSKGRGYILSENWADLALWLFFTPHPREAVSNGHILQAFSSRLASVHSIKAVWVPDSLPWLHFFSQILFLKVEVSLSLSLSLSPSLVNWKKLFFTKRRIKSPYETSLWNENSPCILSKGFQTGWLRKALEELLKWPNPGMCVLRWVKTFPGSVTTNNFKVISRSPVSIGTFSSETTCA